MRNLFELAIHVLLTLLKLSKPGGAKALLAENMAIRQQLVVVGRQRQRVANLTSSDRFIFGVLAGLIAPHRLRKIAVVIKPATFLKFHKALIQRKYKRLYSSKNNKRAGRAGREGPTQEMINLVVSTKRKNPRYGYRCIAMQIYQSFGVHISYFAVWAHPPQALPPKVRRSWQRAFVAYFFGADKG